MSTIKDRITSLIAELKSVAETESTNAGQLAADIFFQALATGDEITARAVPPALRKALPGVRWARAWAAYLETILATEQYRWDQAEQRAFVALRWAEAKGLRGRIFNELGILSDQLGRWQESIHYYRSALALFEAVNDQMYVGKITKNLGTVLVRGVEAGELPKQTLAEAEENERRALAIFTEFQHDGLEAATWNELGTVLKAHEHWAEAKTCYERYLAFCKREKYDWGQGQALNNIAEVLFAQGNNLQAAILWQQALTLVKGHIWDEIDILTHLALAYHRLGDIAVGQRWSEEAIARVESVRARLQASQVRTDFFAIYQRPYQVAASIALARDDTAQVLTLAERAKARTFADLLAGQSKQQRPDKMPERRRRERNLRNQLRKLYEAKAATEEQTALETAWLKLQHQIAREEANIGLLEADQPLTADMIQERLPADTALLMYFETDEELLAILVQRDTLLIRPLGTTLKQMAAATFDRHGRPRGLISEDGRLGKPWLLSRLGTLLLQPLSDSLRTVRHLWLVPHGLLHHLPFAAMSAMTTGGMLSDIVPSMAQAPSATILLRYLQRPPRSYLGGVYVGNNAQRLRYAEQEAMVLARQMAGTALIGKEATITALRTHAATSATIHLACPGVFRPDQPLHSGLVLTDGYLDVRRVFASLRIQAGLVTLSACETGRGHVQAGDEIVGLVRAWLYAGSAAVLVSLWQVDDLSNILLMSVFYRHLATSGAPAALRLAQRALRSLDRDKITVQCREMGLAPARIETEIKRLAQMWGGELPVNPLDHPYFWAAFVLHGGSI